MRIIVGLSGGVDSSVAALLLQQQGYEVQGLFMKNWEEDDTANYCSAAQDVQDAQAVCEQLGIPLHRVNFATEYWETVFSQCLQEYEAGRTPNPDVLCNREIKFKVFLEHALRLGGEGIATGHYARIQAGPEGYQLLKALDLEKDQSYFLHLLNQSQLALSQFPLGYLTKPQVRNLARQVGLANFAKKDSTGLCFIGERPFKTFLQQFLPMQPGPIEDEKGKYLGEHQGLMYYTLGQRQGLNIGGRAGSLEQPWYVATKDRERNCLIVVQGRHHPALFKRQVRVTQLHWISNHPPTCPFSCHAKTRYRQPDQPCVLLELTSQRGLIEFVDPQFAVTPGQSLVLYQGEICLGGGIIEETI